jgi:Spy/CpxP family protein refolding chaperone
MYPGMMGWWKHAHRHGHGSCEGAHGAPAGFGPGEEHGGGGRRGRWGRHHEEFDSHVAHLREAFAGHDHDHDGDFGHFGVRRPLRFLAHKLELEDAQVTELARILNELKTERAQGAVDHRRSTAAIADAIAGESLDETKLGAAVTERVKTAERLREAVVRAIGKIHGLLQPDQRERFAYLIRTGVLSI